MIQLWKYSRDSKAKKRQKTLLGRLIRVCDRSIENSKISLSIIDQEKLCRIKKIHAQSVLKKPEKELYKEENKVLYSFHKPEVECIGKGNLNKSYEFGNKVGIDLSGRGNFVLAIKSFHGNPYDSHTLNQTVKKVKKVVGNLIPNKWFVDLGYIIM